MAFDYERMVYEKINENLVAPWVRTPLWMFWRKPWRRRRWVNKYDWIVGYDIWEFGWEYVDHSDFLFM